MRKRYYVNVYEYEREYGGPEEGGWYYDAGYNGYVWNAYFDEDAAYVRANELCKTLDKYQTAVVEEHKPRDWPEVRPHYE
jgi:hypothetical protein